MTANVTPLWPHNKPDFDRLLKVLRREGTPDRVPFIELFADPEIITAVLDETPIPRTAARGSREIHRAFLQQRIRFCQKVGFDYVYAGTGIGLSIERLQAEDTAELTRVKRAWANESDGVIRSMADYDAYPWPDPSAIDYFELEYVAEHLPEGMQIMATTTGVLENVMWLMGYAPFAIALYEDPELVEALFQRIGDLMAAAYRGICDHPSVGAVFIGDDMGHRSGTMIHPDHLRQYVFPRQKKLVEIAHAHGLPFLLHACGDLRVVMDDLIDDVGIDAKHSFEDTYLPVVEAKKLYGDRVALLGGVDVDFMVRSSEDDVRAYTRRVLEACMPGGGYAMGTGNSVANYIPVRNYLAMLDETMRVGVY